MARVYPLLTDAQLRGLPSHAEATVYRCLQATLDDSCVVIHGKSYVAPRRDGGHRDGEVDFIIFSERYGLLTVEVKGGGVTYDPATGWRSIDKKGRTHEIKDPLAQAKSQKYAILSQLQLHRTWTALHRRIPIGHAVLFPDIDSVATLRLPECPEDIIGGRAELHDISGWIQKVYQFWAGDDNESLGVDGLKIVERILCHPIEVRPLLRDTLDADKKLRIKLTNEQASVLRTLGRHRRAAVVGAAGTGKTVLAVEKARTLADSGSDVLLLCYNRALGVTLSRQFVSDDRVLALTFHQFCHYCARRCVDGGRADPLERARAEIPQDDLFDVQLPLAAFYAIEELVDELQFDAIIVDEGQDFGKEYWLPIEMALRSSKDSWLYVFYDENQRLYSRFSDSPIPESDTFPLTKNCRNSIPVHNLAYRYYKGEPAADSGIDGVLPQPLTSRSPETQAAQIARTITKLIHDEKVPPKSIVVLVGGRSKEYYYKLLRKEPIPKFATWSREEHFLDNGVLMDTVKRFKGLERDVVFLWIDQQAVSDVALLYVGISRAKSVLYVVGDTESVESVVLYEDTSEVTEN